MSESSTEKKCEKCNQIKLRSNMVKIFENVYDTVEPKEFFYFICFDCYLPSCKHCKKKVQWRKLTFGFCEDCRNSLNNK